jgi:hypothetical protein
MKIIFSIGLLVFCIGVNGQEATPPNFKNQGEQEDYWASERFKREYKKESYERYSGPIKELDTTKYQFGPQVLIVTGSSRAVRQLFMLGILYPSLIAPPSDKSDSLTDGQTTFLNVFRADTLRIGSIKELKFSQSSPTVKRFSCWVGWPKIANPFTYLFELTNEQATQETDLETFIKGASLTFFKQGSIII